MVGKVLYKKEIQKESETMEIELPVQQLARGTYLVKINHAMFNKTERLIKLRGR